MGNIPFGAALVMDRQHAVARRLVTQQVRQAQQPGRATVGDQGLVKGFVGVFPLWLHEPLGAFGDRQAIEAVMGGDQLAFPFQVSQANGLGQCLAFNQQARPGDIQQFIRRDAANTETLLVFRGDEAAGGQP
ncbi:hypothetical protein D3C80_1129790 [compost metagenome]